jgi:demethylmenaquinone methyltransferase/2-methoxy-6-polyprenyl-1,4-benzoquinol methylase
MLDFSRRVRLMFDAIAPRYDLLNTLISLGQHRRVRRWAVGLCGDVRGKQVLDLAVGTGDLGAEFARRGAQVVGVDNSLPMLARAQSRGWREGTLVAGDALALPFQERVFDVAATAFALRNIPDLPALFAEMARVTRPGGVVMTLEIGRPRNRVLRWLYGAYMRTVPPVLAALLHRRRAAYQSYQYLAQSVMEFREPGEVAAIMTAAGLEEVSIRLFAGGVFMVHRGIVGRGTRGE